MGIFHKTLSDALKMVKKNDFKKARGIIRKHINEEHGINNEMRKLMASMLSFERLLKEIHEELDFLIQSRYKTELDLKASSNIQLAFGELKTIAHLSEDLVKKVKKEE